ncbi:MAG: glycosyltransferase family 4 protein [Sphingomonadales bacterium]
MQKTTVSIVQRRLTHYRVPLFELLRRELAPFDIDLQLHVGNGTQAEQLKRDSGVLDWAKKIPTRYFLKDRLCWQPVLKLARRSDLLIVTQENALLANHILLWQPRLFKLAFWGHGANLQASAGFSFSERYKKWTTRQVDWWFAYTDLSVDLVCNAGFPEDRITCLNNAIDTSSLQDAIDNVTSAEVEALSADLNMTGGPVGMFLGSLYKHKRLDFLIKAATLIKRQIPDFHLVIVGDGPEKDHLRSLTKDHLWVHVVGPKHGKEKAAYLAIPDLILNPGLVGLNVLDSFAAGVPMVTTQCGIHSPEISYLSDENGIITDNDVQSYSQACIDLMANRSERKRLSIGCKHSARQYSLESMSKNFAQGILSVLKA